MQQRQVTQSTSEKAPPEVIAIQRQRARRAKLTGIGLAGMLLAVLSTGCPEAADLANANDTNLYPAPAGTAGTSSGGGTGGSGSSSEACEVDCVKKIFSGSPASCKLCHSTTMETRLGGLDLQSAGVTSRLKDVASKHTEITPPATAGDCPTGDKLIDVANPAASWLLIKLKGMQKTCGTAMPSTTPLSATDMTCMETYIGCVAGKPLTGGSSGGSGGSAAGGSAAGSTSAGTGGGGGTGGT